jgi:hypothetical protein
MEPSCSPAPDDAGTCPDGTTASLCGGIGYACCCAPPPPPTYACVKAGGCSGERTCECLGITCPDGKMCLGQGGKPDEFHCIPAPQP